MYYVGKVNASESDHPDYVEVPKVVTDREVRKTERVPLRWYEHMKTARENVYETQDMLRDTDGVTSVSLSRSTRKYGGKNGVKIKVGADPNMGIGTTVPEQVGGTPLELEERESISPIEPLEVDGERESIEEGQQMNSDEDNPPCYYNDFSERISGGSNVKAIVDKIFIQSTCMTVKDNSGNKYMLTAAHLWFEDDEYNEPCDAEGSDILGDLAYHALGEDDTLNFTGEVVDASFEGDTALFDDSEDEFEFENLIPNGGLNWGWHSEWSIDSMMCDETEVQKIGIATKKRSGIITDTHVEDTGDRSDCTTLHGHGFIVNMPSEGGDSGGPLFTEDWVSGVGRTAKLVGMTHSGDSDKRVDYTCGMDPTGDITGAYPMYDLHNRYGYSVSNYQVPFQGPLPGFENPPTNTQEIDAYLYEDISGDGDGLDPEQSVDWWTELTTNPDEFDDLTQEQVDVLDWDGDGELTPEDAVKLWSEQVLANDSLDIRINGKSVEEASMAEIRETIRKISTGETSLNDLHEESENEDG